MAGFSSLDDVVAELSSGKQWDAPYFKTSTNSASGVAGRSYDLFTATGIPTAGSYSGSAGVATVLNDASAGAIDHYGDVSPDTKHLFGMEMWTVTATGVPVSLILLDLLLYYPSLVVTGTPTTLDNTATLTRYTDGVGVFPFLVVQTANGAATPSITLTYTNHAGTGSRTSSAVVAAANSLPTTTIYGTNVFIPLQAGDRGVRSVQSYTINSGGTTGTAALVLAREIGRIPLTTQYEMVEREFCTQIPTLPRVYDDACLSFVAASIGAAMVTGAQFQGYLNFGWG